jgi:hypothetical protein
MFVQITEIEVYGTNGTSIGNTNIVKLLHQGNRVYHYEQIKRGEIMLFDFDHRNIGFNLYVRRGSEHGFIVNNTLQNVERLERLILSVAPGANTDYYILNLLEHGYYSIDALNQLLDDDNEPQGLIEYLDINRTGLFVHCP